jgi:hypothetical protein
LDGKYHGAFTDAFLRLLDGQLLKGTYNYAQVREVLTSFLEHRNFAQHPQLLPAIAEDPQEIGTRPFFAMAPAGSSPAAAPAPAAPAQPPVLHLRLESVSAPLKTRISAVNGVTIVDKEGDLAVRQQGDRVELLGPAGDPIVSAPSADPKLVKRIAAQAWLNRVLPAGSNSLGLRAETDPGSRGNTFVQCESFIFQVQLQKPAYVMVLDLDSDGNLTALYPTRASERQVVAAGATRAIPGTDPKSRILVTPPFGSDQVAVIAFERMPAFFADLNGVTPFATDSARADALAKGLASAAGAIAVQQITVHTYPATGKVFCGS